MRTYSESEVSSIIERAVERQQAAEHGGTGAGLTLEEIERIGREAGIDPAHLRAAAAEVEEAGRTLTRQRGQSRTQVFVERWVDAPLTPAAWEDVVAHLRHAFGAPIGAAFGSSSGEAVQQIGRSYEWSHTSPLGVRTRVTVSPRGERTRLQMTQLVGLSTPTVEGIGYGALIAVFVGLGGGVGGAALSNSPAIGLVAALVTFLAAWVVAAPLVAAHDRRWRAKKLRHLDGLADDLIPILHEAEATRATGLESGATSRGMAAQAGDPSAEPRIDPGLLDDPDEMTPLASTDRQRARG